MTKEDWKHYLDRERETAKDEPMNQLVDRLVRAIENQDSRSLLGAKALARAEEVRRRVKTPDQAVDVETGKEYPHGTPIA